MCKGRVMAPGEAGCSSVWYVPSLSSFLSWEAGWVGLVRPTQLTPVKSRLTKGTPQRNEPSVLTQRPLVQTLGSPHTLVYICKQQGLQASVTPWAQSGSLPSLQGGGVSRATQRSRREPETGKPGQSSDRAGQECRRLLWPRGSQHVWQGSPSLSHLGLGLPRAGRTQLLERRLDTKREGR